MQLAYGQDSMELGNASFRIYDSTITVSTGKVERQWYWTGNGFITKSFKNSISGKQWAENEHSHTSDRDLPAKIGANSKAPLISIKSQITDDEKFTSKHILVNAHMNYDVGLEL